MKTGRLPRRRGRLRLDRGQAVFRLAVRGGARYAASAPRLFAAAGERPFEESAGRRTLGRLQDSVPPMSPALAAAVVEEELGAPPERAFAQWDPRPIAAASIGQVHRAVTLDGRAVGGSWVIDTSWVTSRRIPGLDRHIVMTCSFSLVPDM